MDIFTETNAAFTRSVVWEKGIHDLCLILKDPSDFSEIDYKVQHDCRSRCFVRSTEMFCNGERRILYLTEGTIPFGSILRQMDAGRFITAFNSLLQNILEVRRNGFLRIENIDISFEHIFVDPVTYQAYLIYIPVSGKYYPDSQFFEQLLRDSAAEAVLQNPALSPAGTDIFLSALKNPSVTLENLAAYLSCPAAGIPVFPDLPGKNKTSDLKTGFLYLISSGGKEPVTFQIGRDEYVIGRSPERTDGLIRGNRMVGRVHCRIIRRGAVFFAEDMHSANGTWVNGERLVRDERKRLSDGDILQIANVSFRVIIA